MPIDNIINDDEKLVYTTCRDVMVLDDFTVYIERVWGDNRCYGYHELFDTRLADWSDFDFSSLFVVAERASRLPSIDPDSKLAWIVLEGKQMELTDFYKSAKSMLPASSRALQAFFTKNEAIKWLES